MSAHERDAPVFEDPRGRALQAALQQGARGEGGVLFVGPPGSGKQSLARHLHTLSARAKGPFVSVHCAALTPEQLLHELHGFERGAVRGGFAPLPGWFELAQHGTLYLDGVCALDEAAQAALLRVLSDGVVSRIGSPHRVLPVNVRVLAASEQLLDEAVSQGRVRAALAAHVGATVIGVPALRERPLDIVPMARQVLARDARRMGPRVRELSESAARCLRAHAWPGHIRELENVIQQALLRCEGDRIEAHDLALPAPLVAPDAPSPGAPSEAAQDQVAQLWRQLEAVLERLCEAQPPQLATEVERRLVEAVYRQAGQNQVRAAQGLGVSRNVLRGRLIEYGMIDARK